jgi:CHRD domain-containing protein
MTRRKEVSRLSASVAAFALVALPLAAAGETLRTDLTGYEETPVLSTPGSGKFRAQIRERSQTIEYVLSFQDTESDVTQAHIHFGAVGEAGPIVIFLCTNLGNGPAGTQACPATGGTITGTVTPASVGAGAAAQGIAGGEFDEVVRAIRAGATYVNVHTVVRGTGEIRGQIDPHH